jgi:ATP-dependent HslUV protease ATP-binding subunit HslU
MSDLTPRQIVAELDRYIVGQQAAKRAVAIALRNRWRRQHAPADLRDEITPKNILMIGPTGVGKTEIARRMAKLVQAPFVKVEASKFTEVGYVGRDVDSMIRDLVEGAIQLVRAEETEKVRARARDVAEERLVELLAQAGGFLRPGDAKGRLLERLRAGTLNDDLVEVEVQDAPMPSFRGMTPGGMEEINLGEMFSNMNLPFMGKKVKKKKVTVREALELLAKEEAGKLVDADTVNREAVRRAEQSGIVFIDEIDKIAGREGSMGPDVSREGVQRDILPIVEGSTVTTKYGPVKTDHILFVAAGAFHVSKPSDLIPELQGRFPIRVELEALTRDDLVRILTEPQNSLIRQYSALLASEGVSLEFDATAIGEIAGIAQTVNDRTQNIGARRLHTIIERVLDEVSFQADALTDKRVKIDAAYVRKQLDDIVKDEDLSRYIL